jgi:Leucine Rich repeat
MGQALRPRARSDCSVSAQEIDLRGNALGDNGAMIIGRAMRVMQNTRLRRLDLSYNEIADDGAFTLANVRPSASSDC